MYMAAVDWLSVLAAFGDFFLPILATILTIVGAAYTKKLLDKMGLERSEKIDNLIDKYVALGVTSAERFARKKLDGRELDGKDKLSMAITTVLGELEQSGIKCVGEDLIRHRIESYLEVNTSSGN